MPEDRPRLRQSERYPITYYGLGSNKRKWKQKQGAAPLNSKLGKRTRKQREQEARDGRPAIPQPIKRAVRQRCCFGCVICGVPIFDYEHIEEYADVREHKAENITLLCPTHHREKTAGRLSKDLLKSHNADPFNKNKGLTAKSAVGLTSAEGAARVAVTDNLFNYPIVKNKSCPCVTIDGEIVIGFKVRDGALLLDLTLHDEAGGLALTSESGEVAISTDNWDYRLEGTTLSIRSGPGDIIVEVEYLPDGIWIKRGHFVGPKGTTLTISKELLEGTRTDGTKVAGMRRCHFLETGVIINENGFRTG
jgi:trigger factor